MLFNSYPFLFLFLPLVWLAFFGLARLRCTDLAVYAVITGSLVFYSAWNIRFLPILLFSIAFNYAVGRALAERPRKALLAFGVAVNLGLLGYFKYANFFLQNVAWVTGSALAPLAIVLPLGLSFITFQKIAFLVDSYRGMTTRYSFRNFLLFVTFFPQLISGPITHHHDFIPQLRHPRIFVPQPVNLARGAFFMAVGLFKKAVIADTLANWVTPVYHVAQPLSAFEAWVAVFAYAFQIYFDFSGYSEMAVGLGLMFNIQLPYNFLSPYQATSVTEYWRRWHITLSVWLADYVFTPLAVAWSGMGVSAAVAATMVTFLASGLWHGAGWTFILWGFFQGLAVAFDILVRKPRRRWEKRLPPRLFNTAAMAVVFLYISLDLVLYRAGSFAVATHVAAALVGRGNAGVHRAVYDAVGLGYRWQVLVLAALYAWVVLVPNTVRWADRLRPTWPWAFYVACLFLTAVLRLDHPTAFIYFQF